MRQILDPLPWVIGDARLIVEINNGRIKDIELEVLEKRGLKNTLIGRSIELIPSITSVICGLDSWSHYIASLKALDEIYGRNTPLLAEEIRKSGLLLDHIENHIKYLGLRIHSSNIDESTSRLINSLNIIHGLKEIITGRIRNPVIGLAGGVSWKPSNNEINRIKDLLVKLMDELHDLKQYYVEKILNNDEYINKLDDEKYKLKDIVFIALTSNRKDLSGYYNGDLKLSTNNSAYSIGINDFINRRIVVEEKGLIEVAKGVNGEVYYTGPLARLNLRGSTYSSISAEILDKLIETLGKPPYNSIYVEPIARIIELIDDAEILSKIYSDTSWLESDRISYDGQFTNTGIGVVESSRGLIIHRYTIDDNRIVRDVLLIDPSSVRLVALEGILTRFIGLEYDERILNELVNTVKIMDLCIPGASL